MRTETDLLVLDMIIQHKEPLHGLREFARMMLLEMKCKELHILCQEPLATNTGGMPLWGRCGGGRDRRWKFLRWLCKIWEHESADELWMMMNKVARTKTRLKWKWVEYKLWCFKYLLLRTQLDNMDRFLALCCDIHHSLMNKVPLNETVGDVLEVLDDGKSNQGNKDNTL